MTLRGRFHLLTDINYTQVLLVYRLKNTFFLMKLIANKNLFVLCHANMMNYHKGEGVIFFMPSLFIPRKK